MVYLITLFFSFIFVVYATPLVTDFLRKLNYVDVPDGRRKIHKEPVPRLGGVIIYSVLILFICFLFPSLWDIKFFLSGSLIIFLLGLIDDIYNLSWDFKFLGQGLAAIFLILFLVNHDYFNFNFAGYILPDYLTIPILFVFIIGTFNSFNLLDGMDGLVSGFSLILSALSFFFSYGSDNTFVTLLSVILFGVTLGFLKFNSNPASIFLGDSGALTLAYFSLALLFSSFAEASNHNIDLIFTIIVLSVPLIDTLRVMTLRIANKKHPFLPDNNHIHHIIYNKNIRHKTTVFIILIFSLISLLTGIYYYYYSKIIGLILFEILALTLIFIKPILNFILNKENLLNYGRLYRKLPVQIVKIYKYYFLPFVTFGLFSLIAYLITFNISLNDDSIIYLFIFLMLTIGYVLMNWKNLNYISEIFVFINFILFFYIIEKTHIFSVSFPVPMIRSINLNQIIYLLIIPVIVLFILLRERMSLKRSKSFLSGFELIISLLVVFSYLFIKLSDFSSSFNMISDILTRSFMFYLFYKIVSNCFPKLHLPLYFSSFIFVILLMMKAILF